MDNPEKKIKTFAQKWGCYVTAMDRTGNFLSFFNFFFTASNSPPPPLSN